MVYGFTLSFVPILFVSDTYLKKIKSNLFNEYINLLFYVKHRQIVNSRMELLVPHWKLSICFAALSSFTVTTCKEKKQKFTFDWNVLAFNQTNANTKLTYVTLKVADWISSVWFRCSKHSNNKTQFESYNCWAFI